MHLYFRNTVITLAAVASLVVLSGCCGQFFRGSNDVVGLAVSPANSSIQPGNTQQFAATGTFGGSTGGTGDVTAQTIWTSSDHGIATIDSAGLATGIAIGVVTIKGSCQCYTAETTLSVSSQTVSLTSIAVTPANATITRVGTQQFTATGTYSNNTTGNLTNSVTWASSDTTVATVSSTGLATAIGAGNATITATSGAVSGNTTLTVQ